MSLVDTIYLVVMFLMLTMATGYTGVAFLVAVAAGEGRNLLTWSGLPLFAILGFCAVFFAKNVWTDVPLAWMLAAESVLVSVLTISAFGLQLIVRRRK